MRNMKHFFILALLAGLVAFQSGCPTRKGGAPEAIDIDNLDGGIENVTGFDDLLGSGEGLPGRMDIESMEKIVGSNFEAVLFAYDSSRVGPGESIKVEMVSEFLRSNPRTAVQITGHCDERGSREYNVALGERRALEVRSYLLGLGIDGSRVHTVSYGEEMPVAFGHDDSAWSQNRRAEFELYK